MNEDWEKGNCFTLKENIRDIYRIQHHQREQWKRNEAADTVNGKQTNALITTAGMDKKKRNERTHEEKLE